VRAGRAVFTALLVATLLRGPVMADRSLHPPSVAGAAITPVAYDVLAGWMDDDHGAALAAFRISCRAMVDDHPALRPAAAAVPGLRRICDSALAGTTPTDPVAARRFFEAHFTPFRVTPDSGAGFLTGYYQPEVAASLTRTADFAAPVYGRPPDLVTLAPDDPRGALDPALAAARRTAGGLEPYPDRAAILAGALAGQGLERLYLRDEAEVFIVQVQGSASARLADGRRLRLTYAGRNGHPYTSIGRILIAEGHIPAAEMSLARLMGWLRANPAEARRVMSANRSYVFFEVTAETDPDAGPTGGAGVPLTPGRSLAVDRSVWSYGLPVFIESTVLTLPAPEGRLARLTIAQDTGSAIVGPARADYFWGSGDEAGVRAGLTRHPLGFTVLWPRAEPGQ